LAAPEICRMTKERDYTDNELLSVLSARELKDGQVVFAGIGIPLLAACLAQRSHCPGLTILFEGGVIGASIEPGKLPPSTNDQRGARRANMVLGSSEVLLLMQRGSVDVGFMGGAQVDQYGNLNSSVVNARDGRREIRLPGSGGGNDIASLSNLIVAIKHEKRRFVEQVDFITSPGWLRGGETRNDGGLTHGGTLRVITDLAVFGFDPKLKRMTVDALNPDISINDVRDQTGFDLIVVRDLPVTKPPTGAELRVLRELDPDRMLLS
jgi:glutaconate CoA-transferase, subunit B